MSKYKVKQLVMCEVAAYRTIEAESMEAAMGMVAGIVDVTSDCDYEIVRDLDVTSVAIKLEV